MTFPKDATLETVWPALQKRETFVASVCERLKECHLKHGNARVRLGASGHATGKRPCYRIIYHDPQNAERIFNSFDHNDQPFAPDWAFKNPGDWSSEAMTLEAFVAMREKLAHA